MPTTLIRVPASYSEEIAEFKVVTLLVGQDAIVELNQPICELETDKVVIEIPATAAGAIHWLVRTGDTLSVNAPLCEIRPI